MYPANRIEYFQANRKELLRPPGFCLDVSYMAFFTVSSHALAKQDTQAIIDMLDKQIEMAVTDQEKAKLCCYKARNLRKLNQPDMAEQDYLEALELANTGWILSEYSNFLYKTGEFERAYKAALRVSLLQN